MLIDFLKDYGHLGSPLPMAVAVAIAALWLWRSRGSAASRAYVALLAAGYWFVATPFGAALLVRPLAKDVARVDTRAEASGIDTIVLLGGGIGTATVGGYTAGVPTSSSLLRALEAARVFRLLDARLLIASGGTPRPDRQAMSESALLRRFVVDAGVPQDCIIEEARSTTTAEQATYVDELLRARGIRRVIVVTSPTHMRRALGLFRAAGLDAIGSMAPLRSEQVPPPPRLLPNQESLSVSDDALYEYAALTYYWMGGRLASK